MDDQKEPATDSGRELTDDELAQVVGGGLLSSPLGSAVYTRGIQGSGAKIADAPPC